MKLTKKDARLEIKLPEELKNRLSSLTSASGFSMSDIVRWSLIRGMNQLEKEVEFNSNPEKQNSQ